MQNDVAKVEADRRRLTEAQSKGGLAKLGTYARLSGPGWLQSAITLGGGSLGSSLYLGVLGGFTLLWLQPFAMIIGIVMLSAIGYVTISTRERPFQAINRHVNPVLGWSWALASLAANMVWCLPQFALANSVLQQNLLPGVLGTDGSVVQAATASLGPESWVAANAAKLLITAVILVVTVAITWAYDSGSWGVRLYELVLKLVVAAIVLCFLGVVVRLSLSPGGLAWGSIARGLIPDLSTLFRPAVDLQPMLDAVAPEYRQFWSDVIVGKQRDVMISAAATAVGINMTFLFPYSMLRKGWTKEFRGLAIFDLATGMLIPFTLATSFVVIASASQFHTRPVAGFLGETSPQGTAVAPSAKARQDFLGLLKPRLKREMGDDAFAALTAAQAPFESWAKAAGQEQIDALGPDAQQEIRRELGQRALTARIEKLPEGDRRLAAALVTRDAFDLADSLRGLFADENGEGGRFFANVVFGLGVLGMTLSTITLLMLISGFVICEMFGLPQGGWPHRLGCLAACTGALGPFIWGKAAFYLVVPTSVFGYMLIPIAYLTFFLLMNQRSLLGEEMPRGWRRFVWNLLMALAAGVTTLASGWVIWNKSGLGGAVAVALLLLLAIAVQIGRRKSAAAVPTS